MRSNPIIILLCISCTITLFIFEHHYATYKSDSMMTVCHSGKRLNVHDNYYSDNREILESRFPFRKRNDPLVYIRQVFYVFGGAILFMLIFLKISNPVKSLHNVTSWDISLLCITLNLIFSYVFGFVAVFNDWWFFFPDLITGNVWQIKRGQMVLGDVLFYPMAVMMGHVGVLVVKRLQNPIRHMNLDNFLKVLWFTVALAVTLWGLNFGLSVMKSMIYFLYIPFCIIGILLYKKYTGFELWSVTLLFVLCEFLWDLFARIRGIWIFPDSSTHPELYLNEITFGRIGSFPLVWQPEMTQMAFSSGIICLVFFHLASLFLRKDSLSSVTQVSQNEVFCLPGYQHQIKIKQPNRNLKTCD